MEDYELTIFLRKTKQKDFDYEEITLLYFL